MRRRGTIHVEMASEGKVPPQSAQEIPPSGTVLGESWHSKSLREVALLLHHLRCIYMCDTCV